VTLPYDFQFRPALAGGILDLKRFLGFSHSTLPVPFQSFPISFQTKSLISLFYTYAATPFIFVSLA
jgi:hypothetical protein